MKILVIGTIDNKGGAAQVSWELRRRLKVDGHQVSTFVRYKYSNESDVFVIPRKRWQDWLVKLFANDLKFSNTSYILNTNEYREADLIHCHNLHSNFFDLKDIIRISNEKPLIWTLHDMWAFTGFAYNSATLRKPNKKKFLLYLWDRTPNLLRAKKHIYQKSKLFVVTVSDWLLGEAKKSILNGQDILRIYNGIDTDTFKPGDKIEARKILGLPLDKKIIGCGIKGWLDSSKIFDSYSDQNDLFFVNVGDDHVRTTNKNFAVLPRTEDRKRLSLYFQALDLFLHPTPEDSFGLISTEAMSCGIPVVTYNIDALPEIVLHKKTGYVANYQDIEDAKKGIGYILNLPANEYEAMKIKNRQRILEKFTSERMYKEYLELYRKLLASQSNKGEAE
jgi:protein O-GlcNAc transferase